MEFGVTGIKLKKRREGFGCELLKRTVRILFTARPRSEKKGPPFLPDVGWTLVGEKDEKEGERLADPLKFKKVIKLINYIGGRKSQLHVERNLKKEERAGGGSWVREGKTSYPGVKLKSSKKTSQKTGKGFRRRPAWGSNRQDENCYSCKQTTTKIELGGCEV